VALLKKFNAKSWHVAKSMEDRAEDMAREAECAEIVRKNVVHFVSEQIPSDFDLSEEDLQKCADILDVNAFEIRLGGVEEEPRRLRGLYPLTALMNSSCSPNTQNSIDEHFVCRVRAVRNIK